MPWLAVLAAVVALWVALGVIFWAIVVSRGIRFETRGGILPRLVKPPLSLAERNEQLQLMRERQAQEAAKLN